MHLRFFLILFGVIFLVACTSESVYQADALKGTWHCYQWDTNGDIKPLSKGTANFKVEDGEYYYKGGVHQEMGSWKLKGEKLVTQVEGLLQKEVEIRKLENDTMILDMVDNGVPMTMYLVKE